MRTILFVGGGSVGHLAPAVAVWEALRARSLDMRAHFVCSTRGEDARFLSGKNLPHTALNTPRLSPSFPCKFLRSYRQAQDILREAQPDIVFSKGSYVSVPLCFAAHRRGIPIVLHESDAVSGYANRLVSRWAARICLGFPNTKYETPNTKYRLTGNPIRPEIARGSRDEGLRITGFSGERPVLLVLGGSQGARALNEWVAASFDALTELCDVIHLTGRGKAAVKPNAERYWSQEFVAEELPHLYAIASIAVSRAGAGAIAELAANGIPAILVPLRGVGHDHQERNARAAAETRGCIVREQGELRENIVPLVRDWIAAPEKLRRMSVAIRHLHHPEASRQIAEIILEVLA